MTDWPVGLQLRPITTWPGTRTPTYDRRSTFRASFSDTLTLLRRELDALVAERVVLEIAIPPGERNWRNDGRPRAHVRADHPGVVLAFRSIDKARDMRFATDRFVTWQENLRAIALGLEALRKFDRYGLGDDAQYAGFAQLTAGGATPSPERGAILVDEHGSVRAALHATHPDHGGDPSAFADVQAYREFAHA